MIYHFFELFVAITSGFFGVVSIVGIFYNWDYGLEWVRWKVTGYHRKMPSVTPLTVFASVICSCSLLAFPYYDLKKYFWVPFAVDIYGLFAMVYYVYDVIKIFRRK